METFLELAKAERAQVHLRTTVVYFNISVSLGFDC